MRAMLQRRVAVLAIGSLGLTMTAVASGPAVGAATEPCARETLRLPAGAVDANVQVTDPTGRYQVGTFRDADEGVHTALWRDGVPGDLAVQGNSLAVDVSARGEVIGVTNPGDGQWHGWRRRAGQAGSVNLPAPPGTAGAKAVAINARGQVAGQSFDQDGWDQRAVVWSATNALRVLPRPAGFNEATVAGIDDDGTVVGTVSDWNYEAATIRAQRAIAWFPEGTWRFLPGTAADSFVEATSIRHGAVVGAHRGNTTLLWSARSGDPTVLTTGMTPSDISTTGAVTFRKGTDNLLYQPGAGFRQLPQDDPVMGSATAASVTDDEQVYGTDAGSGTAKPVRWIC